MMRWIVGSSVKFRGLVVAVAVGVVVFGITQLPATSIDMLPEFMPPRVEVRTEALLNASFGKWRLALLCFATLPIALIGGVLAAYLGGGVISLGSLVGFFTVLGIVARNGIMLISHYQHLENVEGMTFGPELIMRGALERVVPIMMTVLTTGLALIPLIISGNIPGQEIEYPMAIVILGGLITATILNLFVVPSLYLRFGKQGGRLTATSA